MKRLASFGATVLALGMAGCGGGQQSQSSSGGIEATLISASWEGTPSGQVRGIGDRRLTVAEDLATLVAAVEIKNNAKESRDIWSGGFLLSDGVQRTLGINNVSFNPQGRDQLSGGVSLERGESVTLYLNKMTSHELVRSFEQPTLVHVDDDWRLDLPRTPDHDTLLGDQACFHSYAARIVEQKWVGFSPSDQGLKDEASGSSVRISSDLAGIEAVVEIENVSDAPVLVHGYIDLDPMVNRNTGEDDALSVIPWSAPIAEMLLTVTSEKRRDVEEIPNPLQELQPGEKATFSLQSPLVSYNRLANAGVLAIRNIVDGWQLRLEPLPVADTLYGRTKPAPANAFAFIIEDVDWIAVPKGSTAEALGDTISWPEDSATMTVMVRVTNQGDQPHALGAGFRLIDSHGNPFPSVAAYLGHNGESMSERVELSSGETVTIRLETTLVSYEELAFATPFTLHHGDYSWDSESIALPDKQALYVEVTP